MTTTQTIETAETIRTQIGFWTFATLGASELRPVTTDAGPALRFSARILPEPGSLPQDMTVTVALNLARDTYEVSVTYQPNGDPLGEPITHREYTDVYCDQLAEILRELDNVE